MRKLLVYLVLCMGAFLSQTFAQNNYMYKGLDLFDFQKQEGFTPETVAGTKAYTKESGTGYFTDGMIVPGLAMILRCDNPSAMKWQDIYSEICAMLYSKEDDNADYMPEDAKDDLEYQSTLIQLGRAKYLRTWMIEEFDKGTYVVSLSYKEDGISLITLIKK